MRERFTTLIAAGMWFTTISPSTGVQRKASSTDATKATRAPAQLKLLLTAILIAEVVACGNSKSRVFLGKWEGTGTTMAGAGNLGGMYQTKCKCQLDISSNGESFIIKNDTPRSQCDCQGYEGIYTLTPEGNLRGGHWE